MNIEIMAAIYIGGFIISYLLTYIFTDDRHLTIDERLTVIKCSMIWPLYLLVVSLETWVDIFSMRSNEDDNEKWHP